MLDVGFVVLILVVVVFDGASDGFVLDGCRFVFV